MANLTLAKMLFPTNVTGLTNPLNLATPDPKEVGTSAGTSVTVALDLGASFSIDEFFFGFIGANVTAVTAFTGATLGSFTVNQGAMNLAPSTSPRRHGFLKIASPVTTQFPTFSVAASAGGWSVGIGAVGKALQPTYGHEWGSGRQPVDTAQVSPLRGGGFAVEKGAVKGRWSFTLGDLTDTDLDALWDMTQDIGIGSPLLVNEDPALTGAAMNRALHYGLLESPDVYERDIPNKTRWSLRVQEWV